MKIIHKMTEQKLPLWKNMSDEDLVHYARSQHYGDTHTQFAKSDQAAYTALQKRNLLGKLVEEGTLIRQTKPSGYWANMSDEDLIHYVRSRHFKDTIIDFTRSADRTAYDVCKKRNLLGKLVEEGTLIRQTKPSGYYKDFKNVELEIKKFLGECKGKQFPPTIELARSNASLYQAILKYHGGLSEVKTKLGYA